MLNTLVKSLAITLCVSTILVAGCSKKDAIDEKLMVYNKNHSDDIKTLDPATSYDTISWDIVPQIYETLYQYEYLTEPYKLVPLLAADLPKYSTDRLTLTIPIKRDIKFQDDKAFVKTGGKGRLLTVHDLIFQFKRLALPAIQSQGMWIFDGKIAGFTEFHEKLKKTKKEDLSKAFNEPIAGFKAIDDFTLQIKLTQPYPQLLYVLSMPFAAAVPYEAVDAYGDENGGLNDHPVGSGPYILKEWQRGHRVVLERNPNFHADFYPTDGHKKFKDLGFLADAGKPLPFIDRVHIVVIKEDQPAWLNFMKGNLDAMGIPKDNFQQSIVDKVNLSDDLKKKNIQLIIESEPTFYYIGFNMLDAVVGKNKHLRQAFSSAINREKFIELFTNNRGIKATTVLPPGIPDRPENTVMKYDYNPERAKELLKKAGFPGGKGLAAIKFDMRGADSMSRQMGEFLSQQLGAVGIQLQVIYNTFPAYLEKAKQGNLQVFMGGWVLDYPDAENAYQLVYGPNAAPGPNDVNFNHPEMNKLYKQMAGMSSGPARQALVKQMDDVLQEEAAWGLLYYRVTYQLTQPWLKNLRPNPMILGDMKYLRVDMDLKRKGAGK